MRTLLHFYSKAVRAHLFIPGLPPVQPLRLEYTGPQDNPGFLEDQDRGIRNPVPGFGGWSPRVYPLRRVYS